VESRYLGKGLALRRKSKVEDMRPNAEWLTIDPRDEPRNGHPVRNTHAGAKKGEERCLGGHSTGSFHRASRYSTHQKRMRFGKSTRQACAMHQSEISELRSV